MLKRGKKAISFILSAALIVSGFSISSGRVKAEGEEGYGLSNPRVTYDYVETISFGKYWQEDTNDTNWVDEEDDRQPITWRILKKYDDGTALVLSDKVLDEKLYHNAKHNLNDDNVDHSCTWETSTIREWLNNTFLNEAFTEEEQKLIVKEKLVNSNNVEYGTEGGNDTEDFVFLLSLDDITNEEYGFDEDYYCKDESRVTTKTGYAYWAGDDWWLRSPGSNSSEAACVSYDGRVILSDREVYLKGVGVRPAMRVNISNLEINNKIKNLKFSVWDTIKFGKDEEGKDIIWRVLNVSGDKALILSNGMVVGTSYNKEYGDITWKDSLVRSWLNNDFYESSFNNEEKAAIISTLIHTNNNPIHTTSLGGEDTEDNVFLLSLEDVINPLYGFPDIYDVDSNTRKVYNWKGESRNWWLRSPGNVQFDVAYVDSNGSASWFGDDAENALGIRPALYIDLSLGGWEKGDTFNSDDIPEQEEISNDPTPTPVQSPTPDSIHTTEPDITPTPAGKSDNSSSTPSTVPTEVVSPTVSPTVTPTVSPSPAVTKDKVTTFNIKNKATVKTSSKIKIKDKDKIKKITLNGKTIKIKKNKTSITIKLKSYKKKLKKKGKWNTLKVTDKKGNVKTIKFKTK